MVVTFFIHQKTNGKIKKQLEGVEKVYFSADKSETAAPAVMLSFGEGEGDSLIILLEDLLSVEEQA